MDIRVCEAFCAAIFFLKIMLKPFDLLILGHLQPGVNIFWNSWIIIQEKFSYFNPFGKSFSFIGFPHFVSNYKEA